ncbi:hypothetical protein BA171_02195 [Candidatus Hamiltonella defensa (Bemisia tabaci)]|uniref:Uncharacterized protein n=2 Tax=Candidatus Williamhamiltonella defendens TaxID=138072 RepID=A0A249DY08_9ENTR|nr:hypothetical protein BA171_02195 [Candidatus Hamiltonella defensa (Bemisia tabaci)]
MKENPCFLILTMMCTARAWSDFVSYDNRFPPELAYFQTRVHVDPVLNEEIEQAVHTFLNEIESEMQSIKGKTAIMTCPVRPAEVSINAEKTDSFSM